MKVDVLISTLMQEIRKIGRSESVIGKPMPIGKTHVVPVCELSVGFGSGGAAGEAGLLSRRSVRGAADGGGAGGALSVTPVAFVVVDPKGRASLQSLRHTRASALAKTIDLIPKLADKVLPEKGKSRGKDTGGAKDKGEG